ADKGSSQGSTRSLWIAHSLDRSLWLVAFAPRRCLALRDTLTWDPVSQFSSWTYII
ncbi:hypothetical protein LEMLEM_LOCUS22024, partial [Lemmus lemmus]